MGLCPAAILSCLVRQVVYSAWCTVCEPCRQVGDRCINMLLICDGGSSVLATAVVRMSACSFFFIFSKKWSIIVHIWVSFSTYLTRNNWLLFSCTFGFSFIEAFFSLFLSSFSSIPLLDNVRHGQQSAWSLRTHMSKNIRTAIRVEYARKPRPKSLAGIVTGACWVLNKMVPLASLNKPDRKKGCYQQMF